MHYFRVVIYFSENTNNSHSPTGGKQYELNRAYTKPCIYTVNEKQYTFNTRGNCNSFSTDGNQLISRETFTRFKQGVLFSHA